MLRVVVIVLAVACGAAFVAHPLTSAAEPFPADQPIEQAIDHFIDAQLAATGVSAAAPATDGQLLRRTTLDLAGRIPTSAEARAFVDSRDSTKRQQLVDRLMTSPAFVRHQVDQFDTFLMAGSGGNLREYLMAAFTENRRWDQMFREMLTGRADDPNQKGPLQFVRVRAKDIDRLTNDVSVLFFGVNISCAQCHDHPLVADWTQDHFYGMKSFFARTFENGEFVGERDYGKLDYKTAKGEARNASLMFLTGLKIDEPEVAEPTDAEKKEEKQKLEELKKNKQPPPEPRASRRARLADAAFQSPETSFFARAAVNYLWQRLFGRGLVAPADQLHSANLPSHPELLDWLARDFVAHDYDLRRLTRGIVLSRAYARGSVWDSNQRPAAELFAVSPLRPLTPFQYAMVLRMATTSPDQFPAELPGPELEKRIEAVEGAARGLAGAFEQPGGTEFQVGIDEALLLSNGERIQRELLRDGNDALIGKLKAMTDQSAALEMAAWNIFGRGLTDEERQPLADHLNTRADRPVDAWRQVVWAMLTSGESRFNY